MANKLLKKEDLDRLIVDVNSKGGVFVAPKSEARLVAYKPVSGVADIEFEYIIPRNSFKEYMFPQTEVVANYEIKKDGVDLNDVQVDAPKTVVFGARPCDAVSVASLRSVFTWDFIDEFYTKREDALVVLTVACIKADDECFCTTVGVKPDQTDGSDVMLMLTEEGDYVAEAITDRGTEFLKEHADVFTNAKDVKTLPVVDVKPIEGVDLGKIDAFLKDTEHYDEDFWAEVARKCAGCGACTYSCPTCHCFDITDEGTFNKGERRKNWDACQFDQFTLHASGHNPRDTQYKRWRNRFMCKFNIYPKKFEKKGCVGCGRCIRVCAVRLDITEVMLAASAKK